MPRGGFRSGAGRPRGQRNQKTLTRQRVEEQYRTFVLESHRQLWAAQLSRAMGVYVLVMRTSDGFAVVDDAVEQERILARRSERGRSWWLLQLEAPDTGLNLEINRRLMGPAVPVHQVAATVGLAALLATPLTPDE